MTNAAYQLADALDEWAVPAQRQPEQVRGFGEIDNLECWREVQRVTELVAEVDRTLAGMDASGDNVEMFLETLPKWYAGAHFATTPWGSVNTNSPRPQCAAIELNLLRALGALIDAGGKHFDLTEDQKRTLHDVLAEAKKLVEADTDMTVDVRRYIWTLIVRAYDVLQNYDTFGPGPLREVALELGGAMHSRALVTEHNGDGPTSGRWKSLATMVVAGFAGGLGSDGANALSEVAHRAIER